MNHKEKMKISGECLKSGNKQDYTLIATDIATRPIKFSELVSKGCCISCNKFHCIIQSRSNAATKRKEHS